MADREMRVERNVELDVVRGIAILLVMLGHALQCANSMQPTHPLQQLIMTFWMPLFFFISGYAHAMTGGGRVGRKVRRLLVPYVLWALFVYGCDVWLGRAKFGFGAGIDALMHSGFWFLRMLFEIWFVCHVFQILRRRGGVCLATIGAACVLGVEYYIVGERSIFHYLPLYLIGCVVFFIKDRLSVKVINAALATSPFAFGLLAVLYFNSPDQMVHRLLDIAMAFAGSAAAFFIARLVCRAPAFLIVKEGLAWAGLASLELYTVHWCFLFNTSLIVLPWPFLFLTWLVVSVALIFIYRKLTRKQVLGSKAKQ